MPIPYTKPYLTIPQQIALLKGRQMNITDDAKAADHLRRHGYYRLSGYWYPARILRTRTSADGTIETVRLDDFVPGTSLENIVNLCIFDKKLRMLFMDALERIEVSLRVEAALLLGSGSAIAHREAQYLDPAFTAQNQRKGQSRHDDRHSPSGLPLDFKIA